jgi:hypothetical protein
MTKKKQLSPIQMVLMDIRDSLVSVVENNLDYSLQDFWDEAWDLGYQDGIEEGVRIEKVRAKGIDPFSEEGEKERTKIEKAEKKVAKLATKAQNVSCVETDKKENETE